MDNQTKSAYDLINLINISVEDIESTLKKSFYGDIRSINGLSALIEIKGMIEDLEELEIILYEKITTIKNSKIKKLTNELINDYVLN